MVMGVDIGKAKASNPPQRFIPNRKLKLLDRVTKVMRFKHYSMDPCSKAIQSWSP
jgi:chorismate mutase